jgi:hypothetical protein
VFVNHMRYPVGRIIALNPDIAQWFMNINEIAF